MSAQNSSTPNQPTLSEKALRLLAAHDREVSQLIQSDVPERSTLSHAIYAAE